LQNTRIAGKSRIAKVERRQSGRRGSGIRPGRRKGECLRPAATPRRLIYKHVLAWRRGAPCSRAKCIIITALNFPSRNSRILRSFPLAEGHTRSTSAQILSICQWRRKSGWDVVVGNRLGNSQITRAQQGRIAAIEGAGDCLIAQNPHCQRVKTCIDCIHGNFVRPGKHLVTKGQSTPGPFLLVRPSKDVCRPGNSGCVDLDGRHTQLDRTRSGTNHTDRRPTLDARPEPPVPR